MNKLQNLRPRRATDNRTRCFLKHVRCYLSQAGAPASPPVLPPDLMERLRTLGPHIAADVALMTRLARVVRSILDCHQLAAGTDAAAASEMAKVRGSCDAAVVRHALGLTCRRTPQHFIAYTARQ